MYGLQSGKCSQIWLVIPRSFSLSSQSLLASSSEVRLFLGIACCWGFIMIPFIGFKMDEILISPYLTCYEISTTLVCDCFVQAAVLWWICDFYKICLNQLSLFGPLVLKYLSKVSSLDFRHKFHPRVVCAPCRGVDATLEIIILPQHPLLQPDPDFWNISVSTNPEVGENYVQNNTSIIVINQLRPGWRLKARIPECLSLLASSIAWRMFASLDIP